MVGTAPELAVAKVRRWCRDRVPEQALHQVRVECEADGRDVTIVERRAPYSADIGPEWTTFPLARLRYLTSRDVWRLYWRDRNGQWHQYEELPFARDIQVLLDEIDRDPTAIFWG